MGTGELDECLRGVFGLDLVPTGAHIGRKLPE